MSETIHKYTLEHTETILDLPQNAQLLTVQMQHNAPQLWVRLDVTAPTVQRRMRIHGTGHPLTLGEGERALQYIATFQMHAGVLVFHAFEVLSDEENPR